MAETGTPTAEQVAAKFSEILRGWLTPEQMEQVVERNRAEKSPGVCHSHDFCDANMAMLGAFEALGVPDPDVDDPAVLKLWSDAWDIAFKNEFAAPAGKTGKKATRFRVNYQVYSDMDDEPVGEGSHTCEAADPADAEKQAIAYAHDNDPLCDERIHPMVEVIFVEEVDGEEPGAAVTAAFSPADALRKADDPCERCGEVPGTRWRNDEWVCDGCDPEDGDDEDVGGDDEADFQQVADALAAKGLDASVENTGGGVDCVVVKANGFNWYFGTAGDMWGAAVYRQEGGQGADDSYAEEQWADAWTTVPSFETDAAAVAEGIAKTVAEGFGTKYGAGAGEDAQQPFDFADRIEEVGYGLPPRRQIPDLVPTSRKCPSCGGMLAAYGRKPSNLVCFTCDTEFEVVAGADEPAPSSGPGVEDGRTLGPGAFDELIGDEKTSALKAADDFRKRAAATADVRWRDGGSVVTFTPVSPPAQEWVEDNVHLEPWQRLGESFAVDKRYAEDILLGMRESGLATTADQPSADGDETDGQTTCADCKEPIEGEACHVGDGVYCRECAEARREW